MEKYFEAHVSAPILQFVHGFELFFDFSPLQTRDEEDFSYNLRGCGTHPRRLFVGEQRKIIF